MSTPAGAVSPPGASSGGPPGGPPSPASIFGPLLIGAFLSTLVYGITLVQFGSYYQTSRRDPLWIRFLILYLFIASTCGAVGNAFIAYQPLVMEYGQVPDLAPVFLRADGILTVAVSTPTQLFMAWRILVLTGSWIACGIICLLSIAACIGGFMTSLALTFTPRLADIPSIRLGPTLWLMSSAVCDVIITACLVWALSKKKTGFKDMDSYLTHIIRLAIQTGALTAVATMADAIVFLSLPTTTIFFIWDLSISKLYVNSILSSLNAREYFKEARNALFNTETLSTASGATVSFASYYTSSNKWKVAVPQPGVPQGLPFTDSDVEIQQSYARKMPRAGQPGDWQEYELETRPPPSLKLMMDADTVSEQSSMRGMKLISDHSKNSSYDRQVRRLPQPPAEPQGFDGRRMVRDTEPATQVHTYKTAGVGQAF